MQSSFTSRRNVFVALPFKSGHVRNLKACIERVCATHNFPAEFPSPTKSILILEYVIRALETSQIVIVDITGANANVMYELGYAHSKRGYDPVILICEKNAGLPFDIQGLHCYLFDMNTRHGRRDFEKSIGAALEEINRQAEPLVIDSFEYRTKRLNKELRELRRPPREIKRQTIRYSGSTSAFAFGDDEKVGATLQGLLSEERSLLIDLAAKGCQIKCIITPPSTKAFIPDGRERAIRRVQRLLFFLENNAEKTLARIAWAVSPYFQRNLYIIGNNCCFEGYKTNSEIGFDMTHQHTARDSVSAHIEFYDNLFDRLVGNMPVQPIGHGATPGHNHITSLRQSTIRSLKESLKFLQDMKKPGE